jgi:PelA/Pel-15E family pectate lyase
LEILTDERINDLAEPARRQWQTYLQQSTELARRDRFVLAQELSRSNLQASQPAPDNSQEFELGSKVDLQWLAAPATGQLAETVMSYQTPAGGWSKAVDYTAGPRLPGTHWTSQSGTGWHYCGTLDNRSSTEQIAFLAWMYSTSQKPEYRESALRGIRWLLAAQFPNGGWPQVYPLEPGYHEAITLNDAAMQHAMEVLLAIGSREAPYEWVDTELAGLANSAVARGIVCLQQAHLVIDGVATVWCAQHDPLTLEPLGARLKEPASLSGSESADMVKFLMRRAPDSEPTRAAISAAVNWFEQHKIVGLRYVKNELGKTDYVDDPSSTEIRWARFYDIATQQPIFAGGQDGVIYASFTEMAKNNKVGYDYFTTRPLDVITKEVDRWQKRIRSTK